MDVTDAGGARDRADREPPAQGPDAVRRGRGLPRAGRASTATRTSRSPTRSASRGRSVTESLSLLQMPARVRDAVQALGIQAKSLLLEVLKAASEAEMIDSSSGRSPGSQPGRPPPEVRRSATRGQSGRRKKPYIFRFQAPDKRYALADVPSERRAARGSGHRPGGNPRPASCLGARRGCGGGERRAPATQQALGSNLQSAPGLPRPGRVVEGRLRRSRVFRRGLQQQRKSPWEARRRAASLLRVQAQCRLRLLTALHNVR